MTAATETFATPTTGSGDRPRRKVRLPLIAAALALILATTVLVMWGFTRVADRTEVLVVSEAIPAGTPIPDSALSTTQVAADDGLERIYRPGVDLSSLVASTNLAPGDLLSASMVANAPSLPEGSSEVGAVVPAGRYPSTGAVSDEMLAVPSEGDAQVKVTVVEWLVNDEGRLDVVLAAPEADAPQVAQWAANDGLALVRLR